MSTPNTPDPIEFQFGTIGSIIATPSLSKKENWFFQGEPSVDGKRVRLNLGSGDPLTEVLTSLPAISVNGVVLSAKNAPHISKPGKNGRGEGNPTVTHSGSITLGEGDQARSYVLQATVTFLAESAKLPAGYAINCKAIPMAEREARPARGTHSGFSVATA